jgi:hypothetical protein
MIAIRLSKSNWGKAWRAMVEIAPVRLVAPDPIYEVLPAHLEVLKARAIRFERVDSKPAVKARGRNAKAR